MGQENHVYIAIDLKSFYASVECMERGLDPMTTNLVVADVSRTEKTICLAVSPSLKAYGLPGRCRLFQVEERMKEVNRERRRNAPGHTFIGSSTDAEQLKGMPELEAGYIAAPPRMAAYIEYSTWIYDIYLNYVAPEDIHVYSIDEVFMDVTCYLKNYGKTARQLAETILRDVVHTTGIVPAAGIGTNLYLCKVAMDIVAKHIPPDERGVRIAELDEMSYRRLLWNHRPLTDFWRVGRGYASKLEENGMYTMGDVARCSIGRPGDYHNEELLYRLFGVNAELLIDHAWGWEPCTIADIKAYRPESSSLGSGQVLPCPYEYKKAKLIVREMADLLALELVEKRLVTDQMVLTIGYDREKLSGSEKDGGYQGEVKTDYYGRRVPQHAHGSVNLERRTSSARLITDAVTGLFDRIVDPKLLVRRVSITAGRVVEEGWGGAGSGREQHGTRRQDSNCGGESDSDRPEQHGSGQQDSAHGNGPVQESLLETDCVKYEQLELFTDYEALERERKQEEAALQKERRAQEAVLDIRRRYGKNAILKGMNLEDGATARERNRQIGGHRA